MDEMSGKRKRNPVRMRLFSVVWDQIQETPHPETSHMLSDWKQKAKFMWVKSEG